MLELWWRQMRRSSVRVGASPKLGGVPTALLINAFGSAYVGLLVWRSVSTGVDHDIGVYTWQLAGMLFLALGVGVSKGATKLSLRGTRNDSFLEPLPLTSLARLGLQFMDALGFLPLSVVVPLAAASPGARFWPVLFGVTGFVACFVWGRALIAWARALGPLAMGRWGSYAGVVANLAGILLLVSPLEKVIGSRNPRWAERAAELLLHSLGLQIALALGAALAVFAGFAALRSAERRGIDQLDSPPRPPRAQRGVRDRNALEWQMMLRQGGRALLIVFSLALVSGLWGLVSTPRAILSPTVVRMGTGFILYLGALQTIAHAGRAARSDFQARAFLAALPLSPHQVLEGKARALRKLLIPMLLALCALSIALFARGKPSEAYRVLVTLAALYVVVDGAVSVSFLSAGIGVWTLGGGGQASAGFSTQLLMLPLLATALAGNAWTATTALLAVLAVTWEARRAARLSVRWLDDPADDNARETTVWRALLAATAFFALQAMSFQLFALFELPYGYLLALVFGSGAVLLALLTYRNNERFEPPAFVPKHAAAWLIGPLLGAASGKLALLLVPLLPELETTPEPEFSGGEQVAVVFTMAVLAPLVEEYFFRGWLQRAIEADLPEGRKHWGFVLGATAFALSHLGTYGLPQLVMGLIAGALFRYGGGLWPSILAHAAHNGTVLLLQP